MRATTEKCRQARPRCLLGREKPTRKRVGGRAARIDNRTGGKILLENVREARGIRVVEGRKETKTKTRTETETNRQTDSQTDGQTGRQEDGRSGRKGGEGVREQEKREQISRLSRAWNQTRLSSKSWSDFRLRRREEEGGSNVFRMKLVGPLKTDSRARPPSTRPPLAAAASFLPSCAAATNTWNLARNLSRVAQKLTWSKVSGKSNEPRKGGE